MKTRILFLSILLLLSISSFTASAEEETRKVSSFSEISLRISGNLILEQGDKQSVRIVARPATLEKIITEVKGRSLIIRFQNNSFFNKTYNSGSVDIYVTVPEINALTVSGSGSITANDRIKSRNLDLTVSGSGDIVLAELNAERVKTTVSGSGDILLKSGGTADECSVTISGSGNVKAVGFEVRDVDARITGSGNCSVFATSSLKARVTGSGNVSYKGSPRIDSSVVGSGRVKKL